MTEKAIDLGAQSHHMWVPRELLQVLTIWLRSALDCKEWVWDADQREAALGCVAQAEARLAQTTVGSAQEARGVRVHEGMRQSYLKAVEEAMRAARLGDGDRSDLLVLYEMLWPGSPDDVRAERLCAATPSEAREAGVQANLCRYCGGEGAVHRETCVLADNQRLRSERDEALDILSRVISGPHSPHPTQSVPEKLRMYREMAETPPHGLDTYRQVFFYEQEYYVLSNFSSFNLLWHGIVFPTSEHAYHWMKFPEASAAEARDAVRNAPSAHEAFQAASRYRHLRRSDWDEVKVGIMRDILRAKAQQHEYVRRKLMQTADRELIENSWRDDFWGWGPNRDGQNMLGKLWMQIREELRHLDGARTSAE